VAGKMKDLEFTASQTLAFHAAVGAGARRTRPPPPLD